ncbi:VOC family protein [Dyella halodurans]|uniref:VOC family protein n=1 Tax=Dyella halodurans TaxID=1920171 RepID=A0ABV9C4N0_9GAMM|nr:VOC family protein [Dyella halodurans]
MKQYIGSIALVVADYDAAIDWYTRVLGFQLLEDTDMGGGKRWVVVAPAGTAETRLLLAKASTPEQLARVGDQTGGRVFLLLHTDDFWRDYERMKTAGAQFCEQPREEAYGTVVVFQDLYGNKWDLLQLKPSSECSD